VVNLHPNLIFAIAFGPPPSRPARLGRIADGQLNLRFQFRNVLTDFR